MEKLNQLLMEVKGLLARKDDQIQRLVHNELRARRHVETLRQQVFDLTDNLSQAQRTIERLK